MSKEQNIDKITSVKVSCGNLERIKAISKKGETFDNVVTKLLDYYEDLQREDLINTQSNGNQYKKQINDRIRFYTYLSSH
jgi:hypothetical protein